MDRLTHLEYLEDDMVTEPERDEYGNDYGDDPRISGAEWERDHGQDYDDDLAADRYERSLDR